MDRKINELVEKSYRVRKRFLDIYTRLGYGHLTTAFSEVEILITLLSDVMNYNPSEPRSDKLYLSKGHGAGMIFPVLEEIGVISTDETDLNIQLGGDNSKYKGLFYPGFEFYGGSLGIGLGMAAGHALGAKLNNYNYKVYCIVGDAECYEGSIWEAIIFASHYKLDNLVVIVDRNGLGCSDFTEHMGALDSFEDKWRSFNWDVEVINGHSYQELLDVFKSNSSQTKPLCIIANTIKGKGLDYTINKPLMHGYMPKGDDIEKAYRELDIEVGR